MSDRLEEIKARWDHVGIAFAPDSSVADIDWLIAEVERLRAAEHEVRADERRRTEEEIIEYFRRTTGVLWAAGIFDGAYRDFLNAREGKR